MPKPTQILLVEDHRILREGLRAILEAQPDLAVLGEAEDGAEAVRRARALQPDLVVLDLSMPRMNGLDALADIKRVAPGTRVLILTAQTGDEYVFSALRAGADGYLLKDSTAAELLAGVRSVAAGERHLSPEVAARFVETYPKGTELADRTFNGDPLSTREREVLKLVAEGYRSRQIAEVLSISEKTVEKHRASLMRKLQVKSVSGLTAYAIDRGLVTRRAGS
ncbi:MAG TPA: response regulator transcription factor [Lamprocystis sp. (in: g-proteobacteria)]|nr:response regulator transcription factor [Lamprocystis sp. (in: g-proteobacteria)]